MSSIMGSIGPEQLELLAFELGKIAAFDFLVKRMKSQDVKIQEKWLAPSDFSFSHKVFNFQVWSTAVQDKKQ